MSSSDTPIRGRGRPVEHHLTADEDKNLSPKSKRRKRGAASQRKSRLAKREREAEAAAKAALPKLPADFPALLVEGRAALQPVVIQQQVVHNHSHFPPVRPGKAKAGSSVGDGEPMECDRLRAVSEDSESVDTFTVVVSLQVLEEVLTFLKQNRSALLVLRPEDLAWASFTTKTFQDAHSAFTAENGDIAASFFPMIMGLGLALHTVPGLLQYYTTQVLLLGKSRGLLLMDSLLHVFATKVCPFADASPPAFKDLCEELVHVRVCVSFVVDALQKSVDPPEEMGGTESENLLTVDPPKFLEDTLSDVQQNDVSLLLFPVGEAFHVFLRARSNFATVYEGAARAFTNEYGSTPASFLPLLVSLGLASLGLESSESELLQHYIERFVRLGKIRGQRLMQAVRYVDVTMCAPFLERGTSPDFIEVGDIVGDAEGAIRFVLDALCRQEENEETDVALGKRPAERSDADLECESSRYYQRSKYDTSDVVQWEV